MYILLLFISIIISKVLAIEQIHSALSNNGATISYYSDKSEQNIVHWCQDSSCIDSEQYMAKSEQYYKHGYHYHVETNLTQSIHWYKIMDHEIMEFKNPESIVSIGIVADMGYLNSTVRPMKINSISGLKKVWSASYTRNTLLRWTQEEKINSVWHLGDIGYPDDSFTHHLLEFTYEKAYNGFMNWIQPIASMIPYMVSVGNHESECHSPACVVDYLGIGKHLSNFSAYNTRWKMPSNGKANMWYSWNQGSVHFVSLNTETDWPGAGEETHGDSKIFPAGSFGRSGEFLEWLNKDLQEARKNPEIVWIVAGGHRYYDDIVNCCAQILVDNKVDMYFSGHGHSYERLSAPGQPVWIMTGGAGCEEMSQGNDESLVHAKKGAFDSYTYDKYSVGIMNANKTHLSWVLYDSMDNRQIDSIVLSI